MSQYDGRIVSQVQAQAAHREDELARQRAAQIKSLRESVRMSQQHLGYMTGLGAYCVRALERGVMLCPQVTFDLIKDAVKKFNKEKK